MHVRPKRRPLGLSEEDPKTHRLKWMMRLERRLGREPTIEEFRAEHMRLARHRHTLHARTR